LAPEVLLGLALVSSTGCSPNQDVQPGPPVLVSFSVIDNSTGQALELTDDAGAVEVSPLVHLSALFDRLLDGAAVTNVDAPTGRDLGTPDVVAVVITPALPAAAPAPSFTSVYTPNGGTTGLFFPQGPFITTTASPAFPSGASIKATLDPTRVRSKKGEPFTGEGTLTFHTLAFAAAIDVPQAMVDPDAGAPDPDAGPGPVTPEMQMVTVTFNNITGSTIADHITVTAGGAPFTDVTFAGNDGTSNTVTITPTTTWPPGTTIAVTVDATAADPFGDATGMATTGFFTTSAM
jgi:hypothetical protein